MACGYMQTGAMAALLEAGADPLIKDKQGRDVVLLVDNLRKSMPPSVAALQRIMALEQVAGVLTDRCEPVAGPTLSTFAPADKVDGFSNRSLMPFI